MTPSEESIAGLSEREGLERGLDEAITSSRASRPYALVLFEVDRLEAIGRSAGAETAQRALRAVASLVCGASGRDAAHPAALVTARAAAAQLGQVIIADRAAALAHAESVRAAVDELVIDHHEG